MRLTLTPANKQAHVKHTKHSTKDRAGRVDQYDSLYYSSITTQWLLQSSTLASYGNTLPSTTRSPNSSSKTSIPFDTFPAKVLPFPSSLNSNIVDGADSVRFWLNHPIRWVQVVGIIVALTQKEKIDVILRSNPNRSFTDRSGRFVRGDD